MGIPLFADVALYGLSGMFASNLRPDIGGATWWDWYKYPTAPSGLPDTSETTPDLQGGGGKPDFTATDVYKWLHPDAGAFALARVRSSARRTTASPRRRRSPSC